MDSDVSESSEVQPTLAGFSEPETQAAPEAQSEAPKAPAQSPADSEGAAAPETQAAPEAQSETTEATGYQWAKTPTPSPAPARAKASQASRAKSAPLQ